MIKRRENLFLFMLYATLILSISNDKVAYAKDIIGENIEVPIISAKAILELADEKIEEGRIREDIVILQNQFFNINRDNEEYYVVSNDKELAVGRDGEVSGGKAGSYKMTVFYKSIGLVDYNIEIRTPEIVEYNQITLYGDIAYCLNLQNSDIATYSSSDESIMTVSEDGVIQAQKVGNAIITATINDYQTVDFCVTAVTTFPNYTDEELDLIYAIVQQECATSYEGALAVISCAYNRSISDKHVWKGADPLSQLTAEGQFCYSIDNNWKRYLNGNVYDYVKQAVYDCLYLGKTNHNYLSYRGFEITGAKEFDGNFYFDSL